MIKSNTFVYLAFTLVMAFMLISPEVAYAVSKIDSELSGFKQWLQEDIAEVIAVIALILWALNAMFGWWRGGTDWRAGAGLVFVNIILFAVDDAVSFFQ